MTKAEELLDIVEESTFKIKRVVSIRDGKRESHQKRVYNKPTRPGYKRDPKTGREVKMSREEMENRRKAAKKAARSSSTKRKRKVSQKRSKALS